MIVLLLASVAATSTAVGCGGGDEEIGKAEFIRKGDASCKRAGEQGQAELKAYLKKNGLSNSQSPSPKQVEEIGTDILEPLLKRQVREMRAMGLPKRERAVLANFLEGVEKAIGELEKNPQLAGAPVQLLARADGFAVQYGFQVCGNQ